MSTIAAIETNKVDSLFNALSSVFKACISVAKCVQSFKEVEESKTLKA